MKCEMCNGKGKIRGQMPGLISTCPGCHGKGVVEYTNEEWFCLLPTKTKAVYFTRTLLGKKYWEKINQALNDEDFPEKEQILKIINDWDKWLKEKRDEVQEL